MAYMRGEWYVYSSGEHMEIHHGTTKKGPIGSVRMPMDKFEDLVIMHLHRMDPEEIAAVEARAAEKYEGNFGVDGLRGDLGLTTSEDWIAEMAEAVKANPPVIQPPEDPEIHKPPSIVERALERLKSCKTNIAFGFINLGESFCIFISLGFWRPRWPLNLMFRSARKKSRRKKQSTSRSTT